MDSPPVSGAKTDRSIESFGLPVVLFLCVAVYINGLFGGFLFDDFPNIINNTLLRAVAVDDGVYRWWAAALSSDAGILRRPISMLSFAANIYWFGLNPVAFKLVNLAIHLANGLLIHRLSVWLIPYLRPPQNVSIENRDRFLAYFVTGLWLLHPLNVSGVIYVAQRMNELATLFTLAGVCCYVEGRRRIQRGEPGLLVALSGLITFGILAVFSKENGALIVPYAFIIEAVCFRFRDPTGARSKPLLAFFALTLVLPLVLFGTYLLVRPEWLMNGYSARDFTLMQRLLTEPRILLHYLQWIFLPLPYSMGLFHDDIPLSTGLFSPPGTFAAIAFWVGSMSLAWKVRLQAPAVTFAVAWFLAGHAMESTILPLEIVFEHRNYLPMFGLLLGCSTAAGQATASLSHKLVGAVGLALVMAVAGSATIRAYEWGDPIRLAHAMVENHPNSPRSQYEAGRALLYANEAKGTLDQAREEIRSYFLRAMTLDKRDIYAPIGCILTYFGGREIPTQLIRELESRLRTARGLKITPFLSLLSSMANGHVSMPADDVERLVTAALDNPGTTAGTKAMVFNKYAEFQFNIVHDAQKAVGLSLAAAESDPRNPTFQLTIAKLALALNEPAVALDHVDKARSLDLTEQYASEIERIEQEAVALSRQPGRR